MKKTIAYIAFGLACAVGASYGAASVASVVASAPDKYIAHETWGF